LEELIIPTLRSKVTEENRENKRLGRPPKKVLKKNKGVIGRPKGDKAIMDEYRERLIASPKSKKVLDVILDAALDNDHKHQSAAWKLLVERLMPLSAFSDDKTNSKPSININISGMGNVELVEPLEGVFTNTEGDFDEAL